VPDVLFLCAISPVFAGILRSDSGLVVTMRRRRKAQAARLGIAMLVLLCGCTATAPVNLSGTWAGQFTWLTGPAAGLSSSLELELLHGSRDLSGVITLSSSGQQTFDIDIERGRTTGYTLVIEASGTNDLVTPAAVVLLDLSGGFDTTNMAGTGTQTVNGNEYDIEWSATLVAPADGP